MLNQIYFSIILLFSSCFLDGMATRTLMRTQSQKAIPKISLFTSLKRYMSSSAKRQPQRFINPSIPTIKTRSSFYSPRISSKSIFGYLLGLLGLQWLLSPEEKEKTDDEDTIATIMKLIENKDPVTVEKISDFFTSPTSHAAQRKLFDELIQSPSGYNFLIKVLNNTPEIAIKITSLISEKNIPHIYTTFDGRHLIAKIIEKNGQALNQFAQLAENNLSLLCTTISGSHFVSNIIELQPTIAPTIILQVIHSDSIGSLRVLNSALQHSPYDKTIADYIKNKYDPHSLQSLLTVLIFNHSQQDLSHKIDIQVSTQSLQHIAHNIDHITQSSLMNEIIKMPEIAHLATKALDQEKNMSHDNSYIFYHGQSREYGFLQELYSFLYQAKYGTTINPNFIFTNLHAPIMDEKLLQQKENIRNELTTFDPDNKWKRNIKGHRLFMTAALFGNSNEPDLSPLSYVVKNEGTNEAKLSSADIFKMFGYEHLYETVKNDVEKLHEEHKILSSFGQLLQIVVPKNKITEYVYSAGNKGENEPATITRNQKIETTTDMQKIMEAFPNNIQNSDNKEFVLVNVAAKNGPLDPNGPFKMFLYDAVPDDKKQEYNQKKTALFASITEHIKD